MQAHSPTIDRFLRGIGHRVALVGMKPVDRAPRSMVIWPAEQDDVVDQAAWLSSQYHAVYCNLNPLVRQAIEGVPAQGTSVRDCMIAARRRVLIDIDGHDDPKDVAREQMEAIRAEIGEPLIATDSGNGYGLIYTCQLPNNEQTKRQCSSYLQSLKARYHCVDISVFGAARLTRVIGTLNRSKIDGKRIPTLLLN